jgi:hypothetical protein
MPPTQSRPPHSRYIAASCLLVSAASLAFASRGLFTGYSYWLDEIYSVSASLDTWQQLYERWILKSDVHPPLYHVALKIWMSIFGSTEVATRVLSFSFSAVTLGAFSFDTIVTRRWRRVLALLLVSASPFFAYYSQETRSYSLVLALSSIVTLAVLELRSRDNLATPASGRSLLSFAFYFGSLLLSLTHYFGWIYVFVLSLIGFWENKLFKARSRAILLFVVISLWPAWHVIVGNLGGKSGGEFWIKVSPPIIGTIKTYLSGCLPFLPLERSSTFVLTWSVLAALVFVSVGSWHAIRSCLRLNSSELSPLAEESRFTLLSIGLVVGTMSIVDLHTPMSTTRNFIVLLPPTMLLLSNALVMLANSRGAKSPSGAAAAFLVLVIFLLLSRQSWTGLSGKIQPHQNWKSLAAYVEKTGICSEGCFVMGSGGLHDHYFSGSGALRDLRLERGAMGTSKKSASLEDQLKLVNNLPGARILGFHGAGAKIPDLLAGSKGRACIQPIQSWDGSTFLILPSEDLAGKPEALGMQKCGVVN